jgi:hypothetical protein
MLAKQKRFSYSIAFKLNVIKYVKEHGNRAAEKHFGPSRTEKMICVWRKQEEELQKLGKNKHSFHKHAAKWPQLESEVKKWLTNHRNNGISVSTKMIICEARRWGIAHNINDFAGTAAWCYHFMKRHGLSMRTHIRIALKIPAEYEEKILEFHKFVIGARKNTYFELSQIGNMDEVPLTFNVPSNRTVDNEGATTITIKTSGHEKTHYTAVLACYANGTKLPPMLIFKRKTMTNDKIP